MILLNIFQNADGSFAWLNILILITVFAIGYLISQSRSRKKIQQLTISVKDAESKQKHAENEYKSYRSGHESIFKQHEKVAADMSARVKALEGDIKALSDEKNKLAHKIQEKEEEIKNYSRQVSNQEDKMKQLQEEKEKQIAELSLKLKTTRDELTKAIAWESKSRAAEEEAQNAKAALNDLQRRTVQFDLRLKAASEYAAKVQPLETEINAWKVKYSELQNELTEKANASAVVEDQVNQANAVVDRLNAEIISGKKSIAAKDNVIQELRDKLESATETASKMAGLASEIKMLKETNATLQQELAERADLIKQLRTNKETQSSPTAISPSVKPVPAIAAGPALIAEDEPLHEQES